MNQKQAQSKNKLTIGNGKVDVILSFMNSKFFKYDIITRWKEVTSQVQD